MVALGGACMVAPGREACVVDLGGGMHGCSRGGMCGCSRGGMCGCSEQGRGMHGCSRGGVHGI